MLKHLLIYTQCPDLSSCCGQRPSTCRLLLSALWAISLQVCVSPLALSCSLLTHACHFSLPPLVSFSPHIFTPSLTISSLTHLCSGNDEQTQMVINLGALPALHYLLQSSRKAIRKEVCACVKERYIFALPFLLSSPRKAIRKDFYINLHV